MKVVLWEKYFFCIYNYILHFVPIIFIAYVYLESFNALSEYCEKEKEFSVSLKSASIKLTEHMKSEGLDVFFSFFFQIVFSFLDCERNYSLYLFTVSYFIPFLDSSSNDPR